MAKLTNVKTVDMVNGEITKVAYEGAEYAKVEATRETAKVGDIFLATSERKDITVGAYYEVIYDKHDRNAYSDVNILDDANDTHDSALQYGNFFRKISAPTLEDDIVVITGNRCNSRNAVGDIGKITKVKSYGINVEVPSKPDGSDVNGNSHPFDEVRKATPAEVEKYEQAVKDTEIAEKWAKIGRNVGELRKGDIVRITATCSAPLRDGDLIEVISDSIEMSALVKGGWAVCSKLITPVNSRFNA